MTGQGIYTPFTAVYDMFLAKITDDMFLELTEEETANMLNGLLLSAIPHFEFPRVPIVTKENHHTETSSDGSSYQVGAFLYPLTFEEMNILATYMVVEWLGRQVSSIELIRMKYGGPDFKFSSQANHLQKLQALKQHYEDEGFRLQRLYCRRKRDESGQFISTMKDIMASDDEIMVDNRLVIGVGGERAVGDPNEPPIDTFEEVVDYVDDSLKWKKI